jgi:tetratricopeptide (TPR) repeat protein
LIVHKRYPEAVTKLKTAQELSPLDVSITARISLLLTKVDDHEAAMYELSKLAEDWQTLVFCVQAMDEGAKCKLAHASFKQGELLRKREQNGEALKFYSIAVAASGCRDAGILRARGKCFESLQEYVRAIRDFSAVLTLPNPLISDYCARAVAYMMDEDDEKACRDFICALERDANAARNMIASRPGNDSTLGLFLTSARIAHARKDYDKAHSICEYGLMLDENDADLLALKEKCENHMQKCILM